MPETVRKAEAVPDMEAARNAMEQKKRGNGE